MDKKLPKIFANTPNKKFNNNERVYYSNEARDKTSEPKNKNVDNFSQEKNIYQKLNEIFSSEKYVYKAEVEIKMKTGTIKTKVIGQNRTHLITMDNQLIPITDIEDIKFV